MKRLPPQRPSVGRGMAVAVVLAAAMRFAMAEDQPPQSTAEAATTSTPATAPAATAPASAESTPPAAAAPASTAAATTPPADPAFLGIIEMPTTRLEQMRDFLDRLVQMTPEQRHALADEIREVERIKRDIRGALENEVRRNLSPRERDMLRRYYATFRIEDAVAWRKRVRDAKEDERKKILHEMLTAAAARNITPNPELSAEPGAPDPPRGRGGPGGPGGFGEGGRGGGRGGDRNRNEPPPSRVPSPGSNSPDKPN